MSPPPPMGWPEAATYMVVFAFFAFIVCVGATGRWPWEKK